MSKIIYPPFSPYAVTPQSSWYIGRYKHRSILSDPDDSKLVVDLKHQYRPDLLSNDLYGTPVYWWIFMLRNMNVIRDPIWDMKVGIEIYYPTFERLSKVIGA